MSKKKSRSNLCAPWPKEQEQILRAAVIKYGETAVSQIAQCLAKYGRTEAEVRGHWRATQPLIKGAWTKAEDDLLRFVVTKSGAKRWSKIAEHIPRRNAKQCRERWVNNLDSSVSKASWTAAEDKVLVETQKKIGNRWSEIAKLLPGRPDNAVKNRWYSMMNRQKGTGKSMTGNSRPADRGADTLRSPKKARCGKFFSSRSSDSGSSRGSSTSKRSPRPSRAKAAAPVTPKKEAADGADTSPDSASPASHTPGCGSRARVATAPLSSKRRASTTDTSPGGGSGAATTCGLMHPPRADPSGAADAAQGLDLSGSSLRHMHGGMGLDDISDPLAATNGDLYGFGEDVKYHDVKYHASGLGGAKTSALAPHLSAHSLHSSYPLPATSGHKNNGKYLRRSSQTSSPLFADSEMLLEMEELDPHYSSYNTGYAGGFGGYGLGGVGSVGLGAGGIDMGGGSYSAAGRHHLTQADLASISHSNAGCSSHKLSTALPVADSPTFYDELMEDAAMATDDMAHLSVVDRASGLDVLSPLGSPTDDIMLGGLVDGLSDGPTAFSALCEPPATAIPLAERARR